MSDSFSHIKLESEDGFPFKLGELFLWFMLSYLFFFYLRDLLRDLNFESFFDDFSSVKSVILMITSIIPFFVYSLATYGILYLTHRKRMYVLTVVLLAIMLPSTALFRYFFQEVLQKALTGYGNYYGDFTLYEYFLDNLYYGLFFPWVGGIYYFVQFSRFKEKQRQDLIIQNQKSQLSLLRSQLNPHFLFNSLNNIYSLIYSKSDHSLIAVEKLSGILRYGLYTREEKVSLAKEIDYLKDYIDLENLRYPKGIDLKWKQDQGIEQLKIAPFLLIPFVENAFKHGALKAHPLEISLEKNLTHFIFTCANKVKPKEKHKVGGIGLDNLNQRLKLFYPEQHELNIDQAEDHFHVELKILLEVC
ncbi:MAG: histidine kinase [Bacteroidota bacterium]